MESPFGDAPGAPASPFETGAPSPFDAGPESAASSPFGAGPFAATDSPFAAGPSPFGAGDDLQTEPGPSLGSPPPPVPAAPPLPPPASPLSFGEVDLSGDATDAAASSGQEPPSPFELGSGISSSGQDPFATASLGTPPPPVPAAAPRAPPPPPPGDAEDLEMLFGESPPKSAAPPSARPAGYHVRRRSGKVFGPFQESQIVEMLSKGELLGNEDVSSDGTTYASIGAVPAFGAALRKAAAAEPTAKPAAPAVFGNRMATAKVVEGKAIRNLPRWVKPVALAGLPVLLIVAVGLGAGTTRFGYFFTGLLRASDPAAGESRIAQARAALARGDFASERTALDEAARAVAAAPDSAEAAMIHAVAVATLELRHAAPPPALAQARKAAEDLAKKKKGEVTTLAAQLAMSLTAEPISATAAQEQALEAALAKRKPDPELVALLARSALARGDAARASALASRLAGMENGPRAPLLLARAAALGKDPREARSTFEKLVAAQPELPAAQLELAALEERTGELARAAERLQPLVGEAARAKLAPAERARALSLLGSIAGANRDRAAEADKLLADAVAADPRSADARVRQALHKLARGDAAGAVAVTDPVASDVDQRPELAAVRVRSLALAARLMDATMLADRALQKSPGRSELLLAKAFALSAAGKAQDAQAVYADALARDKSSVEARVELARFALAARELAKAEELLGGIAVGESRDARVLALQGDVLSAKGDPAGAEGAYRKALELDPAYGAAELGLARLALGRGDASAARVALASAAAHEPRNPEILVEYGTLLWKAGELAPAEAALSAALEAAPRNAVATVRLGAVLLQKGDAEGALRRLGAGSNEDPKSAEARLWLGRALLAKGEVPAAIVQLKSAVELSRTEEGLITLGGAYEKTGALTDALESYQAASAVAPSSVAPQERIALLLSRNGACDKALPAFQRAIELDPKAARLRLGLAECTAQLGDHDGAVKLYQAVLKADPRLVQAYFLLARSLHVSKGMAAAMPWYERAAREDPGNPLPHYFLGYAYKESGKKAKALAEFRTFLEKKPDAPEKPDIQAEIEELGGT